MRRFGLVFVDEERPVASRRGMLAKDQDEMVAE